MRSAWEDCNESRRKVLAGKGKSTLSKRADDTRPRLMSTEEKDKVRRAKAQATRQTVSNWRGRDEAQSSNRQRSWSTGSRGKGKGKGKARAKAEQSKSDGAQVWHSQPPHLGRQSGGQSATTQTAKHSAAEPADECILVCHRSKRRATTGMPAPATLAKEKGM